MNIDNAIGAGVATNLANKLAAEFPQFSPEFAATMVHDSYAQLAQSQPSAHQLVALTERFSRQRITDFAREHHSTVPQVLFASVANAGRSQPAAALLERESGGAIIARSAGSRPAAEIHANLHPLLVEIAGQAGTDATYPKPLTDDAVRAADVVITMGCGDVCPVIPGVHYEDWPLGDPALASDEGVRAIRDEIETRVHHLIRSLDDPR